ncbi:MAG: tRNA uridine(34) 5-carboxymethylaminomethyl modification radical SAM/GNAT enzyme Elp3 [Coriobacteriia bacterium]|nr:tRNA uridine(34) 5-carboxymethylaminomethyl modification radical SAM/GNAT enzyme Elp3 [Coriobacteriia bacterium]
MNEILLQILDRLRSGETIDDRLLQQIFHAHNRQLETEQHIAKKHLLPYYLKTKSSEPEVWAGWQVDQEIEDRLFNLLRVKPRRTASGVATVTVITKPWVCSGDCLFCPSDLRMPKSYLSDEPACQRAERNHFDPYLQVVARLRTLIEMGHETDKVELIVLGGSWTDYSTEYQIWFVKELFRALNDGAVQAKEVSQRFEFYEQQNLSHSTEVIAAQVMPLQQAVNAGELPYNQAIHSLYLENTSWQLVAVEQVADFSELEEQQRINETSQHRLVGLSVELRPDAIDIERLVLLRRLGCTKIQMGVQSINQGILDLNHRNISVSTIEQCFRLVRVFGFKIQAHFMLNLLGATEKSDRADYHRFVHDSRFIPDEIKLYPCALVESSHLTEYHSKGHWYPYSEEQLLDVLTANLLDTPSYIRISRMVRDFSAGDILVGNKKTNLRQFVEQRVRELGQDVLEIRYREIAHDTVDTVDLALQTTTYSTDVSLEYFIEWVNNDDRIIGFLRLSLPDQDFITSNRSILPDQLGHAMIREVHIYGQVARLSETSEGPQHLGLGRNLIDTACQVARSHGFQAINVISSVGTREYYRKLGFMDQKLYQVKWL